MQHLRYRSTIVLGSAVCLILCGLLLTSRTVTSAQQAGLFTDIQAARGQALYDKKCAACHGNQLDNGTAAALVGSKFMAKWTGKSVDDLYYITKTQMPYGAGDSLKVQEYIDVVAFVLKANGYKSGAEELKADDSLKQVKILAQSGSKQTVAAQPGETKAAAPAGIPAAKFPTQAELNAAATNSTDWLVSNHDYGGQRFVDLKQINGRNAATLRPVCMYQASDLKAFHTNPLVYRGVMYLTTSTSTMAIDATTCKQKWRHNWRPRSIEVWPPNRGVAIKDGRVVRGTTDGYLFALDMETGKELWVKKVVDSSKNEGSFNMAPVIFENLVLMGLGISEQGVPGWISAFKLEDGEQVWRFNTIPKPGEPGSETWSDARIMATGGGGVWAPMSLDAEAGVLYAPVANPAPDFHDDSREGANLYTNTMLALDVRTGKLKWYYQATPHDTHDYDTTQVSPLFESTVGGKKRKLVAVTGKDGMLHVLDRETKEHLYEVPVTKRLNVEVPLKSTEGTYVCPGVQGGVQWNGPAFNPRTNLLYVNAVDWCGTFREAKESRFVPGQIYMGGTHIADPLDKARGWLTAVDATTGKVAWKYESGKPMLAAVTTTSGDVVFTGELSGDFLTLDAKTGKVLYRFNTGGAMNGGVISYAINGKQYVAAASGSASGFWQVPAGSSTIVIFSLP
ncbi:MAG: PQQ-binding-like beta-propeller repeat protein [Acidobacteria bacterium]|nr:PQQ-binding-like beta-propeller repeat protein [Acidobacteriota bacterium]